MADYEREQYVAALLPLKTMPFGLLFGMKEMILVDIIIGNGG
jgi:hypothetical protein